MTIAKTFFATALASTTLLSTAVFAQDAAFKLPEQCTAAKASGGMDHSDMGHGNAQATPADGMNAGMMGMMGMGGVDLDSMPAHVKENMGKMMVTMPAMHEGMMIENPDVAFARRAKAAPDAKAESVLPVQRVESRQNHSGS